MLTMGRHARNDPLRAALFPFDLYIGIGADPKCRGPQRDSMALYIAVFTPLSSAAECPNDEQMLEHEHVDPRLVIGVARAAGVRVAYDPNPSDI